MAHKPEVKIAVREHFVNGVALSTAAKLMGINYDTARAWKASALQKGDDWDKARTANLISEQGIDDLNQQIIEEFAREMLTTMGELKAAGDIPAVDKASILAQLSDAYSKFARSFAKVNPQYGALTVGLDTLKIIVEDLQENDKPLLNQFQNHLERIGAKIGERYGNNA